MKKVLASLLLLACAAALSPITLGQGKADGQRLTKNKLTIYRPVKTDVSRPLRELKAKPERTGQQRVIPIRPVPLPAGTDTKTVQHDPVLQICNDCDPGDGGGGGGGGSVATTPGLNLLGQGTGFSGPQGTFSVQVAPPDTNGATGFSQYVQIVNLDLAVFDKQSGAVVYGPVPINTLFSGFGGACEASNNGDPIAEYDKMANRWVITQFAIDFGPPFLQCVAVSTSPDATGTYNRYAFAFDNFNDYPKLGVWPDGYYMSFNMFQSGFGGFIGPRACALDRKRMLAGQSATMQCFQLSSSQGTLLPSDQDGPSVPPVGSPNYFLSFGTNSLQEWKFHADFSNPSNTTFTGPTVIPVAAFTPACFSNCVPQPSTTQRLDALGDRLMFRNAYRNLGFQQPETLVVNHSIQTAGGQIAVRWYELRNPQSPSVFQQGTYAPDSNNRWMGSIAMDRAGDIAVGYSVSSGFTFPSIRYTGRVPGDALGTLEGENSIIGGSGSQVGGLSRWGDYSAMAIDPMDDCTFWYTQEYLPFTGSFNWSTRIGSFKFNACSGGNRIDDSRFFVRQHYVDFLLREPDQGGWDFWTNQIEQCGTDTACRDDRRMNVSRAFWESGDFRLPDIQSHFQMSGEPPLVNPAPPPEYNNDEFIRICYRAYLQREPDTGGFNFWLNDLNNCMTTNGESACYNHIIQAFLGSTEYRMRFGQP